MTTTSREKDSMKRSINSSVEVVVVVDARRSRWLTVGKCLCLCTLQNCARSRKSQLASSASMQYKSLAGRPPVDQLNGRIEWMNEWTSERQANDCCCRCCWKSAPNRGVLLPPGLMSYDVRCCRCQSAWRQKTDQQKKKRRKKENETRWMVMIMVMEINSEHRDRHRWADK